MVDDKKIEDENLRLTSIESYEEQPSGYGLFVPNNICPSKILIRKKRVVQQCDANGYYYELLNSKLYDYQEIKKISKESHYFWRGKKGHLAVVNSIEENNCIWTSMCSQIVDDKMILIIINICFSFAITKSEVNL